MFRFTLEQALGDITNSLVHDFDIYDVIIEHKWRN